MDLELSEEQRMIRDTARDFAVKEVEPKAAELDKTGRWPTELVKRMGELGFMGIAVPDDQGGAGMDNVCYALAMEEISRACASTGVIMSVNNSLYCDPISKFGTPAQKERWLAPYASGTKLGCFGLTEPMSGSDAQTMNTVAEKKGERWILNGSKNWITNGPHADTIVLFAITERNPGGKSKHTAFLVDKEQAGFTREKPDEKLGIHAAHSCTVFFENVELSDEHCLGNVGEGFKVAMSTLDGGRIGIFNVFSFVLGLKLLIGFFEDRAQVIAVLIGVMAVSAFVLIHMLSHLWFGLAWLVHHPGFTPMHDPQADQGHKVKLDHE